MLAQLTVLKGLTYFPEHIRQRAHMYQILRYITYQSLFFAGQPALSETDSKADEYSLNLHKLMPTRLVSVLHSSGRCTCYV